MGENNIFLEARLKSGYTQVEVAKRTGISQTTISFIENDVEFNQYKFVHIKKLCDLYKLDIRKIHVI